MCSWTSTARVRLVHLPVSYGHCADSSQYTYRELFGAATRTTLRRVKMHEVYLLAPTYSKLTEAFNGPT